MPKNLTSKKEYRGINTFLLHAAGYESPYWVTYRQAEELGGHVRKGERGYPVIFWKWLSVKGENDEAKEENIPMLRYYTVFNVGQCEGIDEKVPVAGNPEPKSEMQRLGQCDKMIENMPKRPEIRHHEARAYYRPSADSVNMPRPESFDHPEEYYSTLFHELTHSTGHESRLNRKGVSAEDGEWSSFGSAPYAREELVAEMGASFLCGICGIDNKTIDNSAAYINSWLGKLRNDKKMVIIAAAQAQKAADFIQGRKTGE